MVGYMERQSLLNTVLLGESTKIDPKGLPQARRVTHRPVVNPNTVGCPSHCSLTQDAFRTCPNSDDFYQNYYYYTTLREEKQARTSNPKFGKWPMKLFTTLSGTYLLLATRLRPRYLAMYVA